MLLRIRHCINGLLQCMFKMVDFRYLSIQKTALIGDQLLAPALSLCEVLIKHGGEYFKYCCRIISNYKIYLRILPDYQWDDTMSNFSQI